MICDYTGTTNDYVIRNTEILHCIVSQICCFNSRNERVYIMVYAQII